MNAPEPSGAFRTGTTIKGTMHRNKLAAAVLLFTLTPLWRQLSSGCAALRNYLLPVGLCVMLSACKTPPKAIDWWTGAVHGSLYARWALQNSTEGPPTAACDAPATPVNEEPADWWNGVDPNIRGGSDVVGYAVWSNEAPGCSRAMQTAYRSVMMFDLTTLYQAAANNTDLAGLIASAELEFNVIEQPATNPLNWPCAPYMGAVGQLSTLRPGATVTAGLTRVGNLPGMVGAAAFPQPGTPLSDLWNITGPGTRGRVTTTDTGPITHFFRVDVKDVLLGAINNNRQELGFTIQSVGETPISLTSDVQFVCRTWVQPLRLHVTHY
jgi:hypothetical protein